MTEEEFNEKSKDGKTVVCLQYVEDKPDECHVCADGKFDEVVGAVMRMLIAGIVEWSKEGHIPAVKLAKIFAKYLVKYVKKYKDELC